MVHCQIDLNLWTDCYNIKAKYFIMDVLRIISKILKLKLINGQIFLILQISRAGNK